MANGRKTPIMSEFAPINSEAATIFLTCRNVKPIRLLINPGYGFS
jgi:hypothetical protein